MRTHLAPSLNRRQLGFSLPEIMVGMVIGLLGIIIIMQVTSVFEGQKRTTTGGDDAQNGGAIALYTMQRDISQAGYGLSSTNLVTVSGVNRSFVTPLVTFNSLAAVMKLNGPLNTVRDAETDAFVVIYGNSNSTPEGGVIINSSPLPYTITGTSGVTSTNNGAGGHSFLNGDWVIVDDGTGNSATNAHYLYQASGVNAGSVAVLIPGNITQAYIATPILQDTAAGPHPVLYNMGPSPTIQAYAVRNGSLSYCDYLTKPCDANNNADWTPMTGGIVSMKVECVGGAALRVALVARNSQPATTAVTASVPTWSQGGASAPVATLPATLTSWAPPPGVDWHHYRYKTFETIVPIRNAVWTGAPGC